METTESLFDIQAPSPPEQVVPAELLDDTTIPNDVPQRGLIVVSPEWFGERLQEKFKGRVDVLVTMVASTTVESQEVADQLINCRAEAKEIIKKVDDLLKTHIGDPESTIKKIRAAAKGYTSRLDTLVATVNDKLIHWSRLKAIREQELEKERQAEIAAMNQKIADEAAEAGVEAPAPIEVPAAVKTDSVQRTATGAKASVYKRWTYDKDKVDLRALAKAVGSGKVSEEVLQINSGVVQKLIDGGARKIPGLEIYEKEMIRG